MSLCEKCYSQHDGTYGSGRFCSANCSRSFSSSLKREETNKKVSKSLKNKKRSKRWIGKDITRNCKFCEIQFQAKRPDQVACSRECVRKNGEQSLTDEQKLKRSKLMSSHAKRRHESGDKIGWSTRSKIDPSYPESIAIKFLDSENIQYVRELPVGRFFIDFAIEKDRIAIEIDGQQHLKPERIQSDKRKDDLLKLEGWKVFRIKWPEQNVIETIKMILNLPIDQADRVLP